MRDMTGTRRVCAPFGDADRMIIRHAAERAVRDEVLDVVIERIARDLARMDERPRLALRPAPADGPEVVVATRTVPIEQSTLRVRPGGGAVVARIG